MNSPMFTDSGIGSINIWDISVNLVFLPYIDPQSGELKVNMTKFDVDRAANSNNDPSEKYFMFEGTTIMSQMLNYLIEQVVNTILQNGQSIFFLF